MTNKDKTLQDIASETTVKIKHIKPAPAFRSLAKVLQIIAAIVFGCVTAAFLIGLWFIMSGHVLPDWIPHVLRNSPYLNLVLCYLAIGGLFLLVERASDRISEKVTQSRTSTVVEGWVAAIWLIASAVLVIRLLFAS
jgi:uncharacterized membrane protein YgcG